jgi:hypothetical protein
MTIKYCSEHLRAFHYFVLKKALPCPVDWRNVRGRHICVGTRLSDFMLAIEAACI